MSNSEYKDLENQLNAIKDKKIVVENINVHRYENEVPKGRKVYNWKCSVLFVDIRHSTEITDDVGKKNMVKIYQMFTRLVIKAIERYGGYVDQIIGDGIMCTFEDNNLLSGQNAIFAALAINEYLNEVYNPMVENLWKIDCGIGIRTGHIYITKVGLKGNNKCSKVVYPSSITNYASKLCNVAQAGEILFDDSTYNELNKTNRKALFINSKKKRDINLENMKGQIRYIEYEKN